MFMFCCTTARKKRSVAPRLVWVIGKLNPNDINNIASLDPHSQNDLRTSNTVESAYSSLIVYNMYLNA